MNTDGSLKFICQYCEKKNCSFEMLQAHIDSKSPVCHGIMRQRKSMIPIKVFLCENCGEQFASNDLLQNHSEIHTDNRSRTKTKHNVAKPTDSLEFQCTLFQKKFTQFKNFQRHKKQAFDENGKNVCELCDNSYFRL